MQVKCEYCGNLIDDKMDKCPSCGAANKNMKRMTSSTPKTIAELEQWYKDRNLPPYETTRFFIGINYKEKRAFGIYKDGDEFIVYKNKDDGTRAIRYQGTDEQYAVNELYLKLKSEILNQKAHGGKKSKGSFLDSIGVFIGVFATIGFAIASVYVSLWPIIVSFVGGIFSYVVIGLIFKHIVKIDFFQDAKLKLLRWGIYFLCVLMLAVPLMKFASPKYYLFNDTVYCQYQNDYYYYDTYDYYYIDALPVEITNNPADYEYDWKNDANSWQYGSDLNFRDSQTYKDTYLSSSDSDSDYDWSSDSSWDSGSTDWGSDW